MRCDRPPDRDPRLVLAHAFVPGYEFFKKVNVAARLYSFRKNGYLATAT